MKTIPVRKSLLILFGLFLLTAAPLPAQERRAPAASPVPRQVFRDILHAYSNVNDYTVNISGKVNMPTFRVPDFSAVLHFKKPDRFHIETKSFAPIPRQSALFNPFQFDPDKNEIVYLRSENLGGTPADLYRVEPRGGKTPVRYYTVWVGRTPLRIIQVESLSIRGTKAVVRLSYQTVEQGAGRWLLPEKAHVHLDFPSGDKGPEGLIAKDSPLSGGMRRLDEVSGEGDVHIAYGNWRINTGLSEAVFKARNGP
jgi:outer membrane lipoprotein-sorting protein